MNRIEYSSTDDYFHFILTIHFMRWSFVEIHVEDATSTLIIKTLNVKDF